MPATGVSGRLPLRELVALGVLGACLVATVALRWVPAYAPFAITSRTADALRTGDLATLRAQGLDESVTAAIEAAGRAELAERLAIEGASRRAGSAEYDRLARAVVAVGEQRFDALPRSEQSRIRDASYVSFVLTEGVRAGTVAMPPGTDATTFLPESPDVALAARLGKPSLDPADAERLGDRTPADPSLQADPTLLDLAVHATDAGERLYSSTRRQLVSAGQSAFRALDYTAQQEIRGASARAYLLSEGFSHVSDDVKGQLGSLDALVDDAQADALRLALGLASLTPADRARIVGFDGATLSDPDGPATMAFVAAQGAARVSNSLRTYFQTARCVDRGRRRVGQGAGDLYLRGGASQTQLCFRDGRELAVTVSARWDADAHRWQLDGVQGWGALVGAAPAPADGGGRNGAEANGIGEVTP